MEFNSRPHSAQSSTHPLPTNDVNQSVVGSENHFYHYNNALVQNSSSTTSPTASAQGLHPVPPMTSGQQHNTWSSENAYYTQYYENYFREYYRNYFNQQKRQQFQSQTPAPRLRTPLKYGSRGSHARAVFSQHNNSLLVVDNDRERASVIAYTLNDLFVDYLFPKQLFHLLLRGEEGVGSGGLPFASRDRCLHWLRAKHDLEVNFEVKLVLKVIQVLLKQTSVSGLDIAELLFDLVDFERLHVQYVSHNEHVHAYRTSLIRGQPSVALSHALCPQHALFDHALVLSYLLENNTKQNDFMSKTVKRFLETLHPHDPLHVFYNCLLHRNKAFVCETNFESFLTLLSNDLDLNCVQINENAKQFKHLLSLIKALMSRHSTTPDVTLDDDLFGADNEWDSLLINECLEFSRFGGQAFSQKLVPKKLKFASLLFDFGFVDNALHYCRQLRQSCPLSETQLRVVQSVESRFDRNVSFEQTFAQTTDDDNNSQSFLDYNNTSQQSVETTPDDSPTTLNEQQIAPEMSEPTTTTTTATTTVNNESFDYYSHVLSEPVLNDYNPNPMSETMNGFEDKMFSFISSSNALPTDAISRQEKDVTAPPPPTPPSPPKPSSRGQEMTTGGQQSRGGQHSGLLSKLFNFRPKNAAILPDDSKMTLIYDKNTQQWIDTSEEGAAPDALPRPPPGPPVMTVNNPQGGQQFSFRSNKRYVDITDITRNQ